MTKTQFLQALAEKTGHTKKEAASLVDALVGLMYDEVKKAGEVTLPGVGKLMKKFRPARMGRNPATGEQIQIKAKTVVKF
ncbi:DNA-binding protein, partial [Candidatus Uhrbacteria bacterium RIFCSPLOWO2_02_FULL_49_11]